MNDKPKYLGYGLWTQDPEPEPDTYETDNSLEMLGGMFLAAIVCGVCAFLWWVS